MKIIKYDSRYDEQIKDLLYELQNHIVKIDMEKFNIISDDFREKYFEITLKQVSENQGKVLLLEENGLILGLVVGLVNNDETCDYDFKSPKRGRVSELVVSGSARSKGLGKILLNAIEEYLYSQNCRNILIEVLAYNKNAVEFYEHSGYHARVVEMIK